MHKSILPPSFIGVIPPEDTRWVEDSVRAGGMTRDQAQAVDLLVRTLPARSAYDWAEYLKDVGFTERLAHTIVSLAYRNAHS